MLKHIAVNPKHIKFEALYPLDHNGESSDNWATSKQGRPERALCDA